MRPYEKLTSFFDAKIGKTVRNFSSFRCSIRSRLWRPLLKSTLDVLGRCLNSTRDRGGEAANEVEIIYRNLKRMLVFSAILIMRTISKLHIFRIFFSKSKRIFMKKCYPGGRRAPPWRSSPTPGVSTPTPGGKRAFPPAPFCRNVY